MEIGGCVTQSTQTLINISTLLILHSLSLTVSPLTVDVHWILGWSPSQLRFTSCPALYTLPPVLQSVFFLWPARWIMSLSLCAWNFKPEMAVVFVSVCVKLKLFLAVKFGRVYIRWWKHTGGLWWFWTRWDFSPSSRHCPTLWPRLGCCWLTPCKYSSHILPLCGPLETEAMRHLGAVCTQALWFGADFAECRHPSAFLPRC